MPIPIQNPYNPTGKLWKELCKVSGSISQEDHQFLKTKFPADGIIDAIVSSLVKGLIDELKYIDLTEPLERAWYIDSSTYLVLQRLLQRRADREPVGNASSRDDTGTTSGVRKTHGASTKQRAKSSSRDTRRRDAEESKGNTEEK